MDNTFNFTLSESMIEKLEAYSQILEKEPNKILQESLESYFQQAEKMILEKSMTDKDPDTDIGFDEFWEDVDI